jgi:Rrf2 family protein
MPLLPRKGVLAITAVIDIALNGRGRPVAAKALASRHSLPPRHLEPVLQALVRHGILRGIRGPRGGYELARDQRRITAEDILRAAGTDDEIDGASLAESLLLNKVVMPPLVRPSTPFPPRSRASMSKTSRIPPNISDEPREMASRRAAVGPTSGLSSPRHRR